ncbi:hypothetical protein NRIC_24840 [Enterococcus florum]|uniref:DUF2975 domain-containing protein n=1 Tax=Enterococcus florum TaxID=2480627 RepID=A0A4P5PN14_9ENTE|nr:DUF2975 domain-containing protein [Enterococcus florum]GCF94593.1 hypothetical protein NRIC_24840 [Enterococcus florum]
MNAEKNIYRGLKIFFGFLVTMMGVAAAGLIAIVVILNNSAELQNVIMTAVKQIPNGINAVELVSSPIFIAMVLANIFLYGLLFFFTRRFFKNLQLNRIFVEENVHTAKKISVVLALLSLTVYLPNVYTNIAGLTSDASIIDLTYIVGAVIVWALAKILEKANAIAEENELTV